MITLPTAQAPTPSPSSNSLPWGPSAGTHDLEGSPRQLLGACPAAGSGVPQDEREQVPAQLPQETQFWIHPYQPRQEQKAWGENSCLCVSHQQ